MMNYSAFVLKMIILNKSKFKDKCFFSSLYLSLENVSRCLVSDLTNLYWLKYSRMLTFQIIIVLYTLKIRILKQNLYILSADKIKKNHETFLTFL